MTASDVRRCLSEDHVAGRIIRDCASLEWLMGLVICRYYTAQERFGEFFEQFIDRLSFADGTQTPAQERRHPPMARTGV